MATEWPGQRELQGALQQLIAHRELPPASTVNSVAAVALQHAKEYKMVVYEIERFIRKTRAHYRLGGVFVMDALCKLSRAKFGHQDAITPRFGTRMNEILGALADLPEEHLRQARRVVSEWEKRGILGGASIPEFLQQPSDFFDPMNIPSPTVGNEPDEAPHAATAATAATVAVRDPRTDTRMDPRTSRSARKADGATQQTHQQEHAAQPARAAETQQQPRVHAPGAPASAPGGAAAEGAPTAASNPSVGALLQLLTQTLAETQKKAAGAAPAAAPAHSAPRQAFPGHDGYRGYDGRVPRGGLHEYSHDFPSHSPEKRPRSSHLSEPYEKRTRPGSPSYRDYADKDAPPPRRASPRYDAYDDDRSGDRSRGRRDSSPPARRDAADESRTARVGQPPNDRYKTKLCKSLSTGEWCRYGDSCHFAHSEAELRRLQPLAPREDRGGGHHLSEAPDLYRPSRPESPPRPPAFAAPPPYPGHDMQVPPQQQPPFQRPPSFPGQGFPPEPAAQMPVQNDVQQAAGDRPRRSRFSAANETVEASRPSSFSFGYGEQGMMSRGDEPPPALSASAASSAAANISTGAPYHHAMPGQQPWGLNGHGYARGNGGHAPVYADPASAWLSRPTQSPHDLFNFASWPVERPQPRAPASRDAETDRREPVRSSDVGSSVVVHAAVGASLSRTSKLALAPFIVARPSQPPPQQEQQAQQQLRHSYAGANNGMALR